MAARFSQEVALTESPPLLSFTLPVQLHRGRWSEYRMLASAASELFAERVCPPRCASVEVDGGVAIMIFILSFAVMGAMGTDHPFPHVSGLVASWRGTRD